MEAVGLRILLLTDQLNLLNLSGLPVDDSYINKNYGRKLLRRNYINEVKIKL